MDISVVLCTYNRAQHLRPAVQSLLCQETDSRFTFEILVADDASTDETEAVVRELAATETVPIRYFRGKGEGQAATTNAALREVDAEWVAFFDDDQIADSVWLANMLLVARNAKCQGVGSSRRLLFEGGRPPELSQTCRELLGEHFPYSTAQPYQGKLFPQGGCSMITKRALERIGFFEEQLPYGGYDTELYRAARMAGFESWYAPEAVVDHRIPLYRVEEPYFRWASFRMGANFAFIDSKYAGTHRLIFNSVARMGQAVLVHLPRLVLAEIKGTPVASFERRCLCWRTESYVRKTLHLLLPGLLSQKRFFDPLEFRKERTSAMAS
jgi:GT2 family glycosyltransferase